MLEPGLAVIDCGGVGYGCRVTAYTAGQLKLNQNARLYITESIREDAFDLFGFISREEQPLESVEIHDIKVPYITNVTADYVKSPADVKDYLTKQVSSSVRWQQTIERLIADGADEFVEIGPGRSLSGFMRKINRDVKVVNIDKLEDFEKYVNR